MILRSFTLKLLLFSVLTSGLVLLGFSTRCMSAIRRIGGERIDRELLALGDPQVRRLHPLDHWARFDDGLATLYGEKGRQQFAVKVNARSGERLYLSPLWPPDLPEALLGIPDNTDRAPAVPRPRLPAPPFGGPGRFGPEGPPPEGPEFGGPRFDRPPEGRAQEALPTPPRFFTATGGGRTWRFVVMGNEAINLVIGQDLSGLELEVAQFRGALAVAAPLALLLLAVGGWLLARSAFRPVRLLTQVAARMTAKGLDQRVPASNADHEFLGLIDVINGMLDRLERSYRQAVRFSADAAHELKTPLTILQSQLEQAVQDAASESREQQMCAELLEEVQRLKVIVRKLLLLAQADAGELRISREPVDLGGEVAMLCEDASLLAPGMTLTREIAPQVHVQADPDLLRQALQNLLNNAIKHNRAAGSIALVVRKQGALAAFAVSNTTDRDAKLDPARVFERFYRGDPARGRKVEGSGLGLSLSREIARAHGGDIVMDDRREGWITFTLTLPLDG